MSTLEFVIPLDPTDLTLSFEDRLTLNLTELSDDDLQNLSALVHDSLLLLKRNGPYSLHSNEVFDSLYWACCVYWSELSVTDQTHVISALLKSSSSLVSQIDSTIAQQDRSSICVLRNCIKIVVFLMSNCSTSLCDQAEKEKKSKTKRKQKQQDSPPINYANTMEKISISFTEYLHCESFLELFVPQSPSEEFLNLFTKPVIAWFHETTLSRSQSLKNTNFTLYLRMLTKFQTYAPTTTALFELLHLSEAHTSLVCAFLKKCAQEEPESASFLFANLLAEIGHVEKRALSKDLNVAKSLSEVLGTIAQIDPRTLLTNMSVILPHLDGEAYAMRNGIVQMIGYLILHLKQQEENHEALNEEQISQKRKTIESFFDLLLERIQDITSYTRSRVLSVWIQLCTQRCVPSSYLCHLVPLVVSRCSDKSVQVRKVALQLMTSILQHNPFSGTLKRSVFEEKIKQVEEIHKTQEQEQGKCQALLDYLSSVLEFIDWITNSLTSLHTLLYSKHSSDVLGTIEYLKISKNFEVDQTELYFKHILNLIYSKDEQVRTSVVDCFCDLYFKEQTPTGQQAEQMARKVVELVRNFNLLEINAFQNIVGQLYQASKLPQLCSKAWWWIYSGRAPCTDLLDQITALRLLNAIAGQTNDIYHMNLDTLLSIGFRRPDEQTDGDERMEEDDEMKQEHDPNEPNGRDERIEVQNEMKQEESSENGKSSSHCLFLREVCIALSYLSNAKLSVEQRTVVSSHLNHLIKGEPNLAHPQWFGVCEQALNCYLKFHPRILEWCGGFVTYWVEKYTRSTLVFDLSALCFVAGHMSLLLLVRIEQVEEEIKAKKAKSQQLQEEKQEEDETTASLDEFLVTATDDYEIELVKEKAEQEIVESQHLMGTLATLVDQICRQPSTFDLALLQQSACLALCKLSCCSPSFCESTLQLLFTLVDRSKDENLRANIVIALADLTCRFPNLIDPWTKQFYACLYDSTVLVRKYALTVLSHLILNDMIKVKGEISSLALLLQDEHQVLRDLAHMFFRELGRKSTNPIYNVLPDTISRLQKVEKIEYTKFQAIVEFLIEFVEKEKHIEGMVEKLAHRFRTMDENEIEYSRGLAYCLQLLNYSSEKSCLKVITLLQLYYDKLVDDDIYRSFGVLLQKFTKLITSDEGKQLLEEYTQKIETLHRCDSIESAQQVIESLSVTTKKEEEEKVGKKKTKKGRKGRRKPTEEEEQDENDASQAQKRSSRRRQGRKRVVFEEEEQEEDEEYVVE